MATTSKGMIASVRRWLRRAPAQPRELVARGEAPAPASPAPDPRLAVLLREWREIGRRLRRNADRALFELAVFLGLSIVLLVTQLQRLGTAGAAAHFTGTLLAGVGVVLALAFAILATAGRAQDEALFERGLQIEAAVQLLVPGVGSARSLALLTLDSESAGVWRHARAWLCTAVYVLAAVGWLALAVALALGAL